MGHKMAGAPTRRAIALVLTLLLSLAPASAQPGEMGLNERHLIARGMRVFETGGLKVYHSASAGETARRLGRAMAGAVAWFRGEVGRPDRLAVAVLDEADWSALVTLPWPVPHAELNWDLVVMPSSIADFPGFDRWGLDDETLNLALTFHEVGHVIAHDGGISRDNHWIDELVANLFLAAHVRAARPEMAAILAGPPAGFANPRPYRDLVDLDDLYAGVGLEAYAWYQFRLAAAAAYMVGRVPLKTLVAELAGAFPAGLELRRETVPTTLRKLERIAPGVSAALAGMTGDGALPPVEAQPCAAVAQPDAAQRPRARLVVENRTARPAAIRIAEQIPETVAFRLRLDAVDDLPEGEAFDRLVAEGVRQALEDGSMDLHVAPDRVLDHSYKAGAVVDLMDGRCFAFPADAGRLILR